MARNGRCSTPLRQKHAGLTCRPLHRCCLAPPLRSPLLFPRISLPLPSQQGSLFFYAPCSSDAPVTSFSGLAPPVPAALDLFLVAEFVRHRRRRPQAATARSLLLPVSSGLAVEVVDSVSAMKFTKKYQTYMKGMEAELPGVRLKRLKKMLNKCRSELSSHHEGGSSAGCPGHCSVCDGSFFPYLLDEMSAVVGCFNKKAKKLLELHLASGFKKYTSWFTSKGDRSHGTLMKQGKDLVTYAIINAVAMRKILKKYDKIHYSKQGQEFKAQAQSLHIEILQSPWLCELMAFYMNLRRSKKNKAAIELFSDCSLIFDDDRPTLTCNLFDSMRVDISLTCSICLDTVFDPVSLSCGHKFCYLCCCSAASVTIVDGLQSADHKSKCPLCRQEGVFPDAVHLEELNMLLSHSCPEYWEKRLQSERVERLRLAKEHWESQCRAFLGI